MKIRNPNIEIRNKFEYRKIQKQFRHIMSNFVSAIFRLSKFGFVSDFDIRISSLFAVSLLFCAPLGAQDMPLSQIVIPGEEWQLVSEGHQFTEGPACDKQGNVYFVDVPKSQIFRIEAATNKAALWLDNADKISGLMFGGDGRLYGAQGGKKRIVAIDIASDGQPGAQTAIAEEAEPNDLVVTRDNVVYWTDMGNKQVWMAAGKGDKKVVDTGIDRPNGIILWPDQRTLVVSEFGGPYAWTFRIEKDGSLSARSPYYRLRTPHMKKESQADGMTVDGAGRLYVATATGLQVFDPIGRMSGVLLKPQAKFLSNVCFGGPKFDTLYVTCQDKVYCRKVKAEGLHP
jgi:sugar lactone lactonase YvrE